MSASEHVSRETSPSFEVPPDTERVCSRASSALERAACRAANAVTRGMGWEMAARRYGFGSADAARALAVHHVIVELNQP